MSKKNSFIVNLTVMSTFFLMLGVVAINPALNTIIAAFPNLPITTVIMMATLPSLVVVPTTFLAGFFASKVKYKTLALIGILLFVVGGTAPAFLHNDFMTMIISRAVFGIGLGIISPVGNALVIGLYEGQKRATLLGIGTLMMNIGGIVLQFLSGYFANIQWYYSFYPYLLGLLSFVLILLFLPEPEKADQTDSQNKTKTKIPSGVWIISILFSLVMLLNYPVLVNMSSYLSLSGLGNSAVAGVVLSMYTIGGMVSGAAFGMLFKYLKRYIVAIESLFITIGIAAILYGGSVPLIMAGSCAIGFGGFSMMTTTFTILGMLVDSKTMAISISILLSSQNIAVFLSTYWIGAVGKITGDAIVSPVFISMIVMAVSIPIFFIVNPIPKTKTE